MSRTHDHKPNAKWYKGKPHRPNNLGVCMCSHCKYGRMGSRDSMVMKVKRRLRNWWNNKPEKRGAYTD
jgi:hypothetical protein